MVALWAASAALEFSTSGIQSKILWSKISYIGIVSIAPLWLLFALAYSNRQEWLTRWRVALIWIIPVIVLALVTTNEWHGLIWPAITPVSEEEGSALIYSHGPGVLVLAVYSYLLIMAGSLLLVYSAFHSNVLYLRQVIALTASAIIPLIGNLIYLLHLSPWPEIDFTPLAFALTGIIVAFGLLRFQILDILPVARDALIEKMSDGMLVLDNQERIVDINPAACKMLGCRTASIIGQPASSIFSEMLNLHNGGPDTVDSIAVMPINRIPWVEMRVTKLCDRRSRMNGHLIVLRDITDAKKAEEELLRSRDDLERRVRERTMELEAKAAEMERFVYTVSHDLRSPLVTVSGFAGFLKKDVEDGDIDRVESDLRMMEDAVVKMDQLLSETLELSRIGRVANPPQKVPFSSIVQEAIEQISQKISIKGVEVSVEPELPVVYVDRMRLVEVMVNLIENSIKYMGDQAKPSINIGHRKDGEETVFFVRDNGIGIDKSQHEKVFGLFYRVDNSTEGSGAGLAIVKRIIEVHGGRIWIESELGKGCTVCFTIPMEES